MGFEKKESARRESSLFNRREMAQVWGCPWGRVTLRHKFGFIAHILIDRVQALKTRKNFKSAFTYVYVWGYKAFTLFGDNVLEVFFHKTSQPMHSF